VTTNELPRCPECKTELEQLDLISEGLTPSTSPKEGDLIVCGACASINRYSADAQLFPATPAQLVEIPAELREALEACQAKVLQDRTAHIVPSRDPEEIRRAGAVIALRVSDYDSSKGDAPPLGAVQRSCRRCKGAVLVDSRADLRGMIFLCPDCAADLVRARQS
jgi:hypothetical protein